MPCWEQRERGTSGPCSPTRARTWPAQTASGCSWALSSGSSPPWRAVNVDCTVIAEAPRLAGYRETMQRRLSDALGAPVSVKAKRAEALGALGRGEGIACLAVALIEEI